ncbi:hypothetical protein D3C78_1974910 [compost metagenome]
MYLNAAAAISTANTAQPMVLTSVVAVVSAVVALAGTSAIAALPMTRAPAPAASWRARRP